MQHIDVGDIDAVAIDDNNDDKDNDNNPPPITRCIVAGIKSYCNVAELLNSNVIVLCNLKPRVIKGIPSTGMILCCSNESSVWYTNIRVITYRILSIYYI